jgi:hypothetical protein
MICGSRCLPHVPPRVLFLIVVSTGRGATGRTGRSVLERTELFERGNVGPSLCVGQGYGAGLYFFRYSQEECLACPSQ